VQCDAVNNQKVSRVALVPRAYGDSGVVVNWLGLQLTLLNVGVQYVFAKGVQEVLRRACRTLGVLRGRQC
jgi:hypothetical protein